MTPLEHIRTLAADLGVTVFVCLNCEEPVQWGLATMGNDDEPVVFLGALPDDLGTYLVALHELGHHADPDWGRGLKLDREAYAWQWAMQQFTDAIGYHASKWVAAADVIRHHLDLYRRDRRYRRTPTFEALYASLPTAT